MTEPTSVSLDRAYELMILAATGRGEEVHVLDQMLDAEQLWNLARASIAIGASLAEIAWGADAAANLRRLRDAPGEDPSS